MHVSISTILYYSLCAFIDIHDIYMHLFREKKLHVLPNTEPIITATSNRSSICALDILVS